MDLPECLSAEGVSDFALHEGTRLCDGERVWSSVSNAYRVYALTVLMIVSFYRNLDWSCRSRLFILQDKWVFSISFSGNKIRDHWLWSQFGCSALAKTQSVLLFHFCQNAVIQFSRLETVLQHEKTELIINSPCCGKGKLSIEQSTRPENLIITNTKPLPSLKV